MNPNSGYNFSLCLKKSMNQHPKTACVSFFSKGISSLQVLKIGIITCFTFWWVFNPFIGIQITSYIEFAFQLKSTLASIGGSNKFIFLIWHDDRRMLHRKDIFIGFYRLTYCLFMVKYTSTSGGFSQSSNFASISRNKDNWVEIW